jgi:DNA modification methylase
VTVEVLHGDCVEQMALLIERGVMVDSIVTDPPYELSFMSKKWDATGIANSVAMWQLALSILKPGGHLIAFSATRTQHRMVCAIEDAGFEIRDQIGWMYGCLDELTEVATADGIKPYHKTKTGDLVLCYDPSTGGYSYQPILEVVEYEYADTAYRLVGDFGEQVVSRNHRCIVERDGSEVFAFAETLEREANVPVLESLSELRQALHGTYEGTGYPEQDMQQGLHGGNDRRGQHGHDAGGTAAGHDRVQLRSVRGIVLAAESLGEEVSVARVQSAVQRGAAGRGLEGACTQGPRKLDAGVRSGTESSLDGGEQPFMEGRVDLSEPEGCLRGSAYQVRSLPAGVSGHGSDGRVCDGTSVARGIRLGSDVDPIGVSASREPRRDGQPAGEPDVVRDERAAQGVRAWRGHKTAVVRVVPFHYVGKVWCLRVPTGAFVAVRGGVAFPTGNSGFPKGEQWTQAKADKGNAESAEMIAAGFEGWARGGLKPAWEPICVARRPLIGTVAANVLEHGTGAINIDACRVASAAQWAASGKLTGDDIVHAYGGGLNNPGRSESHASGRWPANIIHDGSDEVLAAFAAFGEKPTGKPTVGATPTTGDVYGKYAKRSTVGGGDTGTAARFFYSAKASKADRADSKHPTVKPINLVRYLCRLITPPGGIVLDPFAGSGTTLAAAHMEGFHAIGIERESEYIADIRRRIAALTEAAQPAPQGGLFDAQEAAE